MVMLNDCVAVLPRESLMVTLPLAKVLTTVGVPVKLTVLPDTVATRPVGKPLEAVTLYGLLPPEIARIPSKPERLTVHCVRDRLPSDGGVKMVMLKVCVTVTP